MKVYAIIDETAGNLLKITNEQGLIDYANDAHFVEKDLTKPIDESRQVYACNDIEGAICILSTDMFYVKELDFNKNNIYDLGEVFEG